MIKYINLKKNLFYNNKIRLNVYIFVLFIYFYIIFINFKNLIINICVCVYVLKISNTNFVYKWLPFAYSI